jgi:hypothetical protein
MTTNQYHVHKNLDHDGKAYRPGDRVSLSEKAAAQLIASGVVGTDEASAPAPAPVQAPAEKQPAEPVAGGQEQKTGEPSLDGRDDNAARSEATDVTPPVDNGQQEKTGEPAAPKALEDMNREELRVIAISEGIPAEEVSGTFTSRAAIIELINKKRAQPQQQPEPQQQAEPAIDASANL